jgi:hypothetical protein
MLTAAMLVAGRWWSAGNTNKLSKQVAGAGGYDQAILGDLMYHYLIITIRPGMWYSH